MLDTIDFRGLTQDEVVFAEDSDLANKLAPLLGVRTIEGFHVMVSPAANVAQRFVETIATV